MRITTCLVVPAVAVATVAGVAGSARAATAPAPYVLNRYPVTAEATLRGGEVVSPGPSVIRAVIKFKRLSDPSIPFVATLALPTTSFVVGSGADRLAARADLVPVTPLTGTYTPATTTLTARGLYTVRLSHVTLGGRPIDVGTCETRRPVPFAVRNAASRPFSLISGGTVSGTFEVPKFVGCGAADAPLDRMVAGTGNALTMNLGSDY